MFDQYPDLVGVVELCEMLGNISKKLAYRYLQDGSIPSLKIGRAYKIAKLDVIGFVRKEEKQDSPDAVCTLEK